MLRAHPYPQSEPRIASLGISTPLRCGTERSGLKKRGDQKTMVKRKNTEEYINILTSVRLDGETSRQLKRVTESLDISQSTFIRQAIRNGIAAAGVVA